jgi:hypothetical protein
MYRPANPNPIAIAMSAMITSGAALDDEFDAPIITSTSFCLMSGEVSRRQPPPSLRPHWDNRLSGFQIYNLVRLDEGVARTTYMPETEILKEVLRETRKRADMRQVDVAKEIDRPQSFVSEYETGQRRLDLVELREVCRACGTTLAKLVNEYERRLKAAR